MRLALHFESFMIPKPLVRIRKHPGNLSKSNVEENTGEMLIAMDRFRDLGHLSHRKYQVMKFKFRYILGLFFLRQQKNHKARIEFFKCVSINPVTIGKKNGKVKERKET